MDSDKIRHLLGTELAQDDPKYLEYSVPRTDLLAKLRNFENNRLLIVNATRGSGKSGLLINHKDEISRYFRNDIVIHKFYSDVAFPPDDTSVSQYIAFGRTRCSDGLLRKSGNAKDLR